MIQLFKQKVEKEEYVFFLSLVDFVQDINQQLNKKKYSEPSLSHEKLPPVIV